MRIVLTSGKGLSGAIIRWYTWSWAAHAGVELDNGLYIDATPRHGVSLHEGIAGDVVRSYEILLPDDYRRGVADFLHEQIGRPYDWSAIFGMAARRDWHDPSHWFCSELVAAAFEAAGYPLLRISNLNRVTPRDLLMSPWIR